jgi:hypothetical protein
LGSPIAGVYPDLEPGEKVVNAYCLPPKRPSRLSNITLESAPNSNGSDRAGTGMKFKRSASGRNGVAPGVPSLFFGRNAIFRPRSFFGCFATSPRYPLPRRLVARPLPCPLVRGRRSRSRTSIPT